MEAFAPTGLRLRRLAAKCDERRTDYESYAELLQSGELVEPVDVYEVCEHCCTPLLGDVLNLVHGPNAVKSLARLRRMRF